MEKSLTVTALNKGLEQYVSEIYHSDQEVQYAANDYAQLLEENKVSISMAGVGKAYENEFAERLMRTIKEEEVDLRCDPASSNGARERAPRRRSIATLMRCMREYEEFLEEVYMKKRIHSSLSYLTHSESEAKWRKAQ